MITVQFTTDADDEVNGTIKLFPVVPHRGEYICFPGGMYYRILEVIYHAGTVKTVELRVKYHGKGI